MEKTIQSFLIIIVTGSDLYRKILWQGYLPLLPREGETMEFENIEYEILEVKWQFVISRIEILVA